MVRCRPRSIETPASEEDVVAAVRAAAASDRGVRVVGSGHSSWPLVETDGTLLCLDRLSGLHGHDGARREATVHAGTKLHDLGDPLHALGLAMENLGDVDVQSVAGAISTGTHGTGRRLRNLSSRVASLRLVLADGSVREIDGREPDLLRAARVSLGLLGVVTRVTLQLLPAYRLHERMWICDTDECLSRIQSLVDGNRHFEFFWRPRDDGLLAKTLNPTDAPPDPLPDVKGERIGWSHHVIPSVREEKFHEMEYAVPSEAGPACFARVRARMRERHGQVEWPVEYRTLASDDAWLSTASNRETVTVSIHQDARLPYGPLFEDIEPILKEHGGRPHWGKIHTCSGAELAARYPEWDRFRDVRRSLDPDGLFLNRALAGLFEPGACVSRVHPPP